MTASRDVKIAILGDARNFQQAIKGAEDSASGFGKKLATVGKATAVALAATGVAAVAFGVKSAATYKDVGAEVLKLQRYTGATAEAASRLRFASKMSGIDLGLLTKAMGQLSKNVTGTKLDKLNLGLKTATGKAKPLTAQLLILADRFKSMPAGAEKTALAMKLFGKAGADMLPFLNKGAKGIEELIKQSDALGNTLSGADLDAIKESTKNQRLFAAGWEGVQIQIGRYVLPVLTDLMRVLVAGIGPAVTIVRKIMEKLSPVLKRVTDGFLLMVQWIAWAVIAFGKLKDGDVQWFAEIMDHMFGGEGQFVDFFKKVGDAVKFFGDKVRDALGWVKDNAGAILGGLAAAFGLFSGAQGIQAAVEGIMLFATAVMSPIFWLALLVAALVFAYTHFDGFREVVDKFVAWFKESAVPLLKDVAEDLREAFAKVVDSVVENWPKIQATIQTFISWFSGAAVPAISGYLSFLVDYWTTVFGGIQDAVGMFIGWWDATVYPAVSGVVEEIKTALNEFRSWWDNNWTSISEAVGHAVVAIQTIIGVFVVAFMAHWRVWGDDLQRIATAAWAQIHNTVVTAIDLIRGVIEFVLAVINGDWAKAWDAFKDIAAAVWDYVTATARNGVSALMGVIGGIANTIASVAVGMFDGMVDAFKSSINSIIRMWNDFSLTMDVPDFLPGPDKYTIQTPNVAELRAMGGPVFAGSPYLVGEKGPELFIPRSAGTIIPNGQGSTSSASAAAGGNQTIVVKIGDEVVARVVANAGAVGKRRGIG